MSRRRIKRLQATFAHRKKHAIKRAKELKHKCSLGHDSTALTPGSCYSLPEDADPVDQHLYLFFLTLKYAYEARQVVICKTPIENILRFEIISDVKRDEPNNWGNTPECPASLAIRATWEEAALDSSIDRYPRISITTDIFDDRAEVRGVIKLYHDPRWIQWAFQGGDECCVEELTHALEHPKNPQLIRGAPFHTLGTQTGRFPSKTFNMSPTFTRNDFVNATRRVLGLTRMQGKAVHLGAAYSASPKVLANIIGGKSHGKK